MRMFRWYTCYSIYKERRCFYQIWWIIRTSFSELFLCPFGLTLKKTRPCFFNTGFVLAIQRPLSQGEEGKNASQNGFAGAGRIIHHIR
jgi:hypothetical protein